MIGSAHDAVWLFVGREGLRFNKHSSHVSRLGDIVIMHNLGPKKAVMNRHLIKGAGARLWFLLPYSPDFTPIEQAFENIKRWIRTAHKRAIEDTWC